MNIRLSLFLCAIGLPLFGIIAVFSSPVANKLPLATRLIPELHSIGPSSHQDSSAASVWSAPVLNGSPTNWRRASFEFDSAHQNPVVFGGSAPLGSGITVIGQNAGPTPFISNVQLMASDPSLVKSITFTIAPKPGSVTRPISALYTTDYLESRGYFNPGTGEITVPVFGLYANYNNDVTLDCSFSDNSTQQLMVSIQTAVFSDSCGYNSPTVVQPRTNDTSLSYDYLLFKVNCGTQSPLIIDTDGALRWVGTAGVGAYSSIFFDNGIYISTVPPNAPQRSGVSRMELDGTIALLRDYADMGVTHTGHHNYDPGKRGILVEVDTFTWMESVILEIDPTTGNVLKTWNLADIITAAMIAGGDNPADFVQPGVDWFHNNAAAYRASDDSVVVSSRENFVICLDYETGAIKWILGDPTKQWYQFHSLRSYYALTLGPNTLPPIGEHATSISHDDHLLLFDNGRNSLHHNPPGDNRSYSAPRKYRIDQVNRVATEVWNYPNGQSFSSPFCSSVYEDQPLNYLIDYASGPTPNAPILIGLNSAGDTVFNYYYGFGCGQGWNAIPVHFEQLAFTSPPLANVVSRMSHGSAGTFDVSLPLNGPPGIECRSSNTLGAGNYVLVFKFMNELVSVDDASVTSGTGSVSSSTIGPDAHEYIVNLTGVANEQRIVVKLSDLADSAGNVGSSISVSTGVLLGDVNGNSAVNSSDIGKVKSQSGSPVTGTNFRGDINANGSLNSGDISLVKSKSGTALP